MVAEIYAGENMLVVTTKYNSLTRSQVNNDYI